jgi:hypothetical protein
VRPAGSVLDVSRARLRPRSSALTSLAAVSERVRPAARRDGISSSLRLASRLGARAAGALRREAVRDERLRKVVVCAQKQPGCVVELRRPLARDEDDWQLLAEFVAELTANLVSRRAGEGDPEEGELPRSRRTSS